jgi:hypothetical protein
VTAVALPLTVGDLAHELGAKRPPDRETQHPMSPSQPDGVLVTCWDGTAALGAGRAVALNP